MMSEPMSGGAAMWIVGAAAALGAVPETAFGVVCGAFVGATVLVLSAKDEPPLTRVIYMFLSLIAGVMLAGFVSGVVTKLTPSIEVPHGVCSLVTSAVAVRLLQWLIGAAKDPVATFDHLRGRK